MIRFVYRALLSRLTREEERQRERVERRKMRNRGTNPFFQPWKAPLFARIYLCLNNLKAALFLHDWPRSSKLERFQRSDGSKLRLIENLEVDSSNAEFRLIKKSSGKGFWEDRRVSSSIANGSKFSSRENFIESKRRIELGKQGEEGRVSTSIIPRRWYCGECLVIEANAGFRFAPSPVIDLEITNAA